MRKNTFKTIHINNLFLDTDNPRYGTYDRGEKNDMLSFMISCSPKKILELLKDILDIENMNPLSKIGVIFKNKKWVVVDGNRRIVCLKILLMTHQEANTKLDNEILKFWNNNQERIVEFQKSFEKNYHNKVEVVVFENRELAYKWIERLHTQIGGHTTQSWETFERYLSQKDRVTIFVHEKMKSMKISRKIYVELVEHSIWKRIFDFNIFKNYFGIKKTSKEIEINDDEFEPKIIAMINLLDENKIKYSKSFISINQAKDTISLIDKELEKIHDPISKGGRTSSHIHKLKKSGDVIFEYNKSIKSKKNRSKPTINTSLDKHIKNEKILSVLKQIRKLNMANYKEIICLSLRMLVEVSAWEFLNRMMDKSNRWLNDNNLEKWILEVIKEIKKSGYLPKNKTTMNHIERNISDFLFATNGDIHDVDFISTEKELKVNLKRIEKFLEELWRKLI